MSAPDGLSAAEGAALLGIARAAVRHHLALGPAPALPEAGPLAEARGAFVTLSAGDELRGCIGTFTPRGSLALTVAEVAVSAARDDPRFEPVTPGEVDALDYDVSVLAPARPMRDLTEIAIGRDGLLVLKGYHRGTLLPRVALEQGWDAATFLKHTCLKAGLPPDAWRDPEARVEAFAVQEFSTSARS